MNPEKSNPNPQISVLQAQISHHSTPNQSINSIYVIQKSIFQFIGNNCVQQRTQKSNINNTFFKQIPPLIPLSLSLSLYASLFQVDVETDVAVAKVGQSKKRTFKKFSFRGVDLDALIYMYFCLYI